MAFGSAFVVASGACRMPYANAPRILSIRSHRCLAGADTVRHFAARHPTLLPDRAGALAGAWHHFIGFHPRKRATAT